MAIAVSTPGSGGVPYNAPLGAGYESGVNAAGGVSVVKVTGLSSDVITTATNLLTAYNGDIEILNIILETGSTGFATSTNIQVLTDNAYGGANILVETRANLSANVTVDLNTASVTKQRTVIEQNKHLQINCTGSNSTGAGTWRLYVEYRPLVPGASLA